MITVLSIPRTGTRFYLYFVKFVLGLEVEYMHFFWKNVDSIEQLINDPEQIIIVPVRSYEESCNSYATWPEFRQRLDDEFVPVQSMFADRLKARAHFMDITKSDHTVQQFEQLLHDLNVSWTPEVTEYIEKWEPIGSQHRADDPKSDKILEIVT